MILTDVPGLVVGFVLTVLILSYMLFDDNMLFRLGAHLLVGISAGYLLAVMVGTVLIDQYLAFLFRDPLGQLPAILLLFILFILMILRLFGRSTRLATLPIAFMVGVGAAVIVGGSLTGTFLPQAAAAAEPSLVPFDLQGNIDPAAMLENWAVLIGTLATLAYFHFGARPQGGAEPAQPPLVRPIAIVGRGVLMITLGVLYAGALLSALAVFVERIVFLIQTVILLGGGAA
jgi:hypothetical protein